MSEHEYYEPRICHTVAQLIAELQKLPADLPIMQGFEAGVKPVVFNWKKHDRHLEFEEVDWGDDCCDEDEDAA